MVRCCCDSCCMFHVSWNCGVQSYLVKHMRQLFRSCRCSCKILKQEFVPVLGCRTSLDPVRQQSVLADSGFPYQDLRNTIMGLSKGNAAERRHKSRANVMIFVESTLFKWQGHTKGSLASISMVSACLSRLAKFLSSIGTYTCSLLLLAAKASCSSIYDSCWAFMVSGLTGTGANKSHRSLGLRS